MFFVVYFYRIGNFFHRLGLPIIGKFISLINRFLFSTWLPSSATIGKNFTLGYGGLGTVIHINCVIGNNVSISQNVTIGRNIGERKVPIIGDDVYIGAGSIIFGEIEIGNNVIIGSNSLVNKSIPDNCTVVGNPMRIIEKDRTLKYYELDIK
ncbi:serine acetyltransferase [Cyclobacterium amurskyense]|uniref:serine O-acetyltransferase n=1 Tax=Cyclobacterium amurskyense TaxID=320787 RepID=UPI0030D92176|tara:strand:+ start:9293 stop:9748 length:456 start_codon:yes stop_codon:yes gene_type:complete